MKKHLALILALVMALSLCACGKSAEDASAPQTATEEYASDSAADRNGLALTESAADTVAGASSAPETNPEKIIYSSDVTVETTAFDDTIERLGQLVSEYDGWVESSSVSGTDYYSQARGSFSGRSASYTLRIPSEKFQTLMNSISELGNVPYTYTYTENVTTQYYDTDARLTAYTAQEARLLEMMESAETVSDLIAIEERLSELRYQIESLQSTLNNWDRRVSYSTVYLSIQEVREYTPETEISFGRQLWLSLQNGVLSLGNFFKNLLISVVGILPALVILAVLVLILVPVIKKRRAKRKARKQDNANNGQGL